MPTKTLKVRVKDKHSAQLRRMAISVNYVWNYVNELSYRAISERRMFLSGFDIQKYAQGANEELGLNAQTVHQVCHEYAAKRFQKKKNRLAWRKSFGARRSLGWVPMKKGAVKWRDGAIYHYGRLYEIWDSYGLHNYEFRSASFNEDSRGRWYFNVVVDVDEGRPMGDSAVGVDLGLKDIATCSNGDRLENGRFYRGLEGKLATAQRARNKKRARNIHAKIKNRRKDALHKFSRKLVNQNAAIFVGNVSSSALVKTKMAKSVYDAGWGQLKTMLEYKCAHAGVVFEEVNEAYTTQSCSSCGVISDSSPKGRAGLGMREWTCECGVTHDRDINAAKNILALGHGRLAGEIPTRIGAKGE